MTFRPFLFLGTMTKFLNLRRLLEYGARNNRTDKQTIQEMHDMACELGASCRHENAPGMLKDGGYMEAVTLDPTTEAGMAWHNASAKGKRCVADVMKQGKDQSAAIAICRASLGEAFEMSPLEKQVREQVLEALKKRKAAKC